MAQDRLPRVLMIGGLDPQARRGIEAGLKTAAAFGVYGTAVATEIGAPGAENRPRHLVPGEVLDAQWDAAMVDGEVDAAVVVGLGDAESVSLVAGKLKDAGLDNVVVNPGLVAGAEVAPEGEGLHEVLKSELLPLSSVVIPNIPECELLTGLKIRNAMGMKAAAKLIHRDGAKHVVVTGARLEGDECTDCLFDGSDYMDLPSERIAASNIVGIGDTYAAAVAAGLAFGRDTAEAVAIAKVYVTECLARPVPTSEDRQALNHLYAWWEAGGARGYGG